MTSLSAADALDTRIADAIRALKYGEVATYGGIAERVGLTRGARRVARALASGGQPDVPWYRVLRAGWRIAFPADSRGFHEQRRHLIEEGHQVKGRQVLLGPAMQSLDRALWGP